MSNNVQHAIDLKRATVRIEGESPLLMPRTRHPEETLSPQEEFERSLRQISPSRFGFPSDGVFSALMTAAGRSLRGVVNLLGGPLIEITGSQPRMRQDPVADPDHPVTCRAEFYPWELVIRLQYDCARMELAELIELFERAGFQVGIGSHRPERGGTFGTFTVKNVLDGSHSQVEQISSQEWLHWPAERRILEK